MRQIRKTSKALDRIIQNFYEDKVCSNLTNERFVKLRAKLTSKDNRLNATNKCLRKELSTVKEESDNATKFMRLVKRYT